MLFLFASLVLMGCEKDEEKLILSVGAAPVLSASSTNVVLTEENAGSNGLTMNWSAADFGFKAAVEYTLQIDTAGDNFVRPYNIALENNTTSKSFTVQELNTLMTRLKYTPEETHPVKMRIRAAVSEFVDPVYSNVLTVNITPYNTYIEPTYIYVPGDYQGWDPGTAPSLISVEANNIYRGIISFTEPNSRMFKFTAERSWALNYGGGSAPGTLAENGPDLSVPANDSYLLTVNLNDMTWTAAKHSWGVIGSATANGWDADQNMRYINKDGVWKATLNLTAGEIKFRFNDAWEINYGGSNGTLEPGGPNIPIASAGRYEITFKLDEEEGTASYTLTKL